MQYGQLVIEFTCQGRIQDMKFGVAQMGGYKYIKNTIIIVHTYISIYFKYTFYVTFFILSP